VVEVVNLREGYLLVGRAVGNSREGLNDCLSRNDGLGKSGIYGEEVSEEVRGVGVKR